MPIVKCRICGKQFYAKPFLIKRGCGKYCSIKCQHLGARRRKLLACYVCGKKFYRKLSKVKKGKKCFCNKSCQTTWRNSQFIGPKHANWKTGLYAYRSVLLRQKVRPVCRLCGTKDDRVLETHHIDRNRRNNKISNLMWLCRNCHFLVHRYPDGL